MPLLENSVVDPEKDETRMPVSKADALPSDGKLTPQRT